MTVLTLWTFVFISLLISGISFIFEPLHLSISWALRVIFIIFTLIFLILAIIITSLMIKHTIQSDRIIAEDEEPILSFMNQRKSDNYQPPTFTQNSKKDLEDYYEEDTYYSGLDPLYTI